MRDRFLTSSIILLILVLASVFVLPERSISRFMEGCGEIISDTFGF